MLTKTFIRAHWGKLLLFLIGLIGLTFLDLWFSLNVMLCVFPLLLTASIIIFTYTIPPLIFKTTTLQLIAFTIKLLDYLTNRLDDFMTALLKNDFTVNSPLNPFANFIFCILKYPLMILGTILLIIAAIIRMALLPVLTYCMIIPIIKGWPVLLILCLLGYTIIHYLLPLLPVVMTILPLPVFLGICSVLTGLLCFSLCLFIYDRCSFLWQMSWCFVDLIDTEKLNNMKRARPGLFQRYCEIQQYDDLNIAIEAKKFLITPDETNDEKFLLCVDAANIVAEYLTSIPIHLLDVDADVTKPPH